MRLVEDAPTIAVAAARMDSDALQAQKDLDLVLSELDPQALVPMDVWSAVVHRFHVYIAVRVQRGVFPFARIKVLLGQRLERRPLHRLKALTA